MPSDPTVRIFKSFKSSRVNKSYLGRRPLRFRFRDELLNFKSSTTTRREDQFQNEAVDMLVEGMSSYQERQDAMLLNCKSDANEASSGLVSSGAAVKSGWYGRLHGSSTETLSESSLAGLIITQRTTNECNPNFGHFQKNLQQKLGNACRSHALRSQRLTYGCVTSRRIMHIGVWGSQKCIIWGEST